MAQPPVSLHLEQSVLNANLLIIQNVWKQRLAQHSKGYDGAYSSVSARIKKAASSQDKVLVAVLAKLADIALKPLGIYGSIVAVALAGIADFAKSSIKPGKATDLPAPSPLSFSKDMEGLSEKMFEPLFRESGALAMAALKTKTVPYSEFRRAKSKLLTSPIWYPPSEVPDGLVQTRMEICLWAAYFSSLADSSFASHELRFLDDIVSYLMDEALISPREAHGWERYPTPITQGGPGDWRSFLHTTRRFWNAKLDEVTNNGWLLPLPQIPENALIQKSVNWTAPKPEVFKAPTPKGRATIIVQSVEMTLQPAIDWKDVPELNKKAQK